MLCPVRRGSASLLALGAALLIGPGAAAGTRLVTIRYTTPAALHGLDVKTRVEQLGIAEVATADLRTLRARRGIVWAQPAVLRRHLGGPRAPLTAVAGEWQYAATRADLVPARVRRAAARLTIAVIDTGADMSAPDLAAKRPVTYSAVSGGSVVTDTVGHGTFVASLAAGSPMQGIFAGFGGAARLMIVQANSDANDFTDATEAAAIVWAVDHGAQIINLSLGGPETSQVEQAAIAYAARHGVLLVAAAGNGGENGDLTTYPAALVGANGLAVGASTSDGQRASFSTAAPYVSLLAPGVSVLGSLSSTAPNSGYPRASVAGRADGLFGYGTGTSYAAPQVAGAAALVWAANPRLTARQVAAVLEQTASGHGVRTPASGYGVLDVAAAVAAAQGRPAPAPAGADTSSP